MKKKKTTQSSPSRVILSVLCTLLGVILVVMLAGTVYAEYLLGLMNYETGDSTLPLLSQEEIAQIEQDMLDDQEMDPNFTGPDVSADEVEMATRPQEQIGDEDHITNILLIGQDTTEGPRARSDSMILCTFNKETNTITMTSIMRDMYVKIPGYKNNRINAAYNFGGMELLNETLAENFGLHIDGNVEVDFDRFTDIINLLGGVEIELTGGEASFINLKMEGKSSLKKGVALLSGEEALWYARYRGDASGDFNRTSRQRNLLSTLIEEYKSISISKMVGLLKDILPMLTTDLTKDEIVAYALEYFPMLTSGELVMQRIPVDGGYDMVMIDGMSVLRVDFEKNIQALADSLS